MLHVDPYAVATVYVGSGVSDQAVHWLDKAGSDVATWLTIFVKRDPRCDPLRSDPRFVDLLRRMRLPTTKDPKNTKE